MNFQRPKDTPWTDDLEAQLIAMWADDVPVKEIAMRLGGLSKNAVVGKAHRLKLPRRLAPLPRSDKDSGRPLRANASVKCRQSERVRKEAFRKARERRKKRLADLRESECRWPVTDGSPHYFCGCPAVEGKPYCQDHCEQAYVKPPKKSGGTFKLEGW